MVLSVLSEKFHKTHRFLEIFFTKTFIARITSYSLISLSQIFFPPALRSLVLLSFLLNKFSKNLSDSLLISTELSASLLSIFNFLTVLCVAFVFSRFRKHLVDFSPSSYHWHLLLTLMSSALSS